jgi:hypothetical protein
MPHLTLRISVPDANKHAALTLALPAGAEVQGILDVASFSGDWTADKIHTVLNDTANRQQAEALGTALFDRLFAPGSSIRKTWDALPLSARQLPLEIEIEDPALRVFPWELLWDSADRTPARIGGLARRTGTPSATPSSSEWPFRLLIIVGADDEGQPPSERIGAMQEVQDLRRALIEVGRSVDINILPVPTRKQVQDALLEYQPHVIHFIGHGGYDPGRKRHCVIIDNPASTWNWLTTGITNDLTGAGCVPRLVFLNCCRSASERDANLSLQTALSDYGVPVVVAMQADVRGDKAAAFSRTFYTHALIGGPAESLTPVIDAVREGRQALGSEEEIDWGLPTLTFCRDVPIDYALLKRRQWPDDADFRRCREFDDARVYADAGQARRRMIEWFYPVKPRPEPNILILRGPTGSGKTRLLHWCMESWAAENPRQRFLRVDAPRGKNCLSWLIRLRAGSVSKDKPDDDRFLKQALEVTPFLPFYAAVARATGLPPTRDPQEISARIQSIDTFQREVTDDVPSGPLFESFLAGLAQIGKIVVVFDQLSATAIDRELFAAFRDSFVAPISAPGQTDTRIVLAMTVEDYDHFGLAGLKDTSVKIVDVKADHSADQLKELAVEAMRYRGEEDLRKVATAILAFHDSNRIGLGRLEFCQLLLAKQEFQGLGRMR